MSRLGRAANMKNRAKAQAVVEFALVIPIVLVLVLGIIEGGWLMFTYTAITSGGREAARYGSGIGSLSGTPLYNDCTGIKNAAMRIGTFAGIKPTDIHIYHDTGPDTAETEYCTPTNPTATFGKDDRIVVTVEKTYTPISPLVLIPAIPLRSQNAHTVLIGSEVVAVSQVIPVTGQMCDVTDYTVLLEKNPADPYTSTANPKGPIVSGKIINSSGVPASINRVSIYWNPGGGSPTLLATTGIPGLPATITTSPVGQYTSTAPWTLNTSPVWFTLTFSKQLQNNVIIRFTLADGKQCSFGL